MKEDTQAKYQSEKTPQRPKIRKPTLKPKTPRNGDRRGSGDVRHDTKAHENNANASAYKELRSDPNVSEKLQKALAQAGEGSRREMEILIAEGHVRVNGEVAKLGDRVLPHDRISVRNHLLRRQQTTSRVRVILYNKPDNQVCTRKDEEGRDTVFSHLPMIRNGRWIMVGRLDLNTSGVLLFTNNGELAYRLMHPKYAVEREYAVRVLGKVDEPMLRRLKAGVMLEDGIAKFDQIRLSGGEGANVWYHVILHEGKNKEVRRLWESQGVTVSRLTRVRYGDLTLPPYLHFGRWEELEGPRLQSLLKQVDMSGETQ